jgi:hypothetical protein
LQLVIQWIRITRHVGEARDSPSLVFRVTAPSGV